MRIIRKVARLPAAPGNPAFSPAPGTAEQATFELREASPNPEPNGTQRYEAPGRTASGAKRIRGFTLIEVMVSMTILTLASLGILALANQLRRMAEENLYAATAVNVAQSIMEQLASLPVTAPTGAVPSTNYLDNPDDTVTVSIAPGNSTIAPITLDISRPPLSNVPTAWGWEQIVVPAVASVNAGVAPKNITVLVAVSVTEPDADNTRQINVFYTYVKPPPANAIGPVKSFRLVTF